MATKFLEPGSSATFDFSLFSSISGATVTSDSSVVFTGPRSIRFHTTLLSYVNKNAILADAGRRISFRFRFDTLPASTSAQVLSCATSGGGADVLTLYLSSAGKLVNTPVGATPATGTTTLSTNTWYQVCFCYSVTNTTTYQVKVYVNGVLDSTTSAGTLTGVGTSDLYLVADTNFGDALVYVSDIYVDDTNDKSYPGDIRVTAKRPNANGTTNGFTTQIGAGGSGYGTGHAPQVNERALSTTNGWSMIGAGSAITEEYNIENKATGDVDLSTVTIVDYVGWLYAKALASETASLVLNGATSNVALTSTTTMFTAVAGSATYPGGTGADIGIITTTALTTVSLYEAGILVAYTPAVAVTVKKLPALGVG